MIARDSFEKSLPRFASAAPFLCLIEDHLLCPDTHRLPHRVEEQLMHTRIFRQLGVERSNEEAILAHEHRLTFVLGEHADLGPNIADAGGADEDTPQRLALAHKREVGLEARDLAAVRVPVDLQVDETEM